MRAPIDATLDRGARISRPQPRLIGNSRILSGAADGGRIHDARYKALARPGVPVEIECQATKVRLGNKRALARYDLRFYQGETLVYVGDQTAMWLKIEEGMELPASDD